MNNNTRKVLSREVYEKIKEMIFSKELAQGDRIPEEKMAETTMEWPHVFAKLPFDHNIFLEDFDANHCHAVYGDHIESLKVICSMLNIDCEVMGE